MPSDPLFDSLLQQNMGANSPPSAPQAINGSTQPGQQYTNPSEVDPHTGGPVQDAPVHDNMWDQMIQQNMNNNMSTSEKIANALTLHVPGLPAMDPSTQQSQEALRTSMIQGSRDAIHGIHTLLRDITDKLGLSDPAVTQQIRSDYDSDRAQYDNSNIVKQNPGFSTLGLAGPQAVVGAGAALATGGIGGGLLRNVLGDAGAGAIQAATVDPGAGAADPITARIKNALGGGAISAALGAPLRLLGAANAGAFTPANVAAQTARVQNATALNTKLTVGQIANNPTTMATEAGMANQLPGIGGKGGLLAQREAVKGADADFIQALTRPGEQAKKTFQNLEPILDEKVGPFSLDKATATAQAVKSQLSKIPNLTPEKQRLSEIADNISLVGTQPYSTMRSIRSDLDDVLYGSNGSMKMTGSNAKMASAMRNSMESDIQGAANQGGVGDVYQQAKNDYRNSLAADKIQTMYEHSYVANGQSPLKFGLLLKKNADSLMNDLAPAQRPMLQGLVNLHMATQKVLKNIDYTGVTLGKVMKTGAGLAAAAMGGTASTVIGGGLVKAYSTLLNSQMGRDLLTHAGRLGASSTTLSDMALRFVNGTVGNLVNQQAQPPATQQPNN